MNQRHTSKVAFREIKEDGTLGSLQRLAFDTLRRHGPLTGQELGALSGAPGIWKRLSELERRRLIKGDGTRKCRVTGRMAIVWAAVDPTGAQLDMFGTAPC